MDNLTKVLLEQSLVTIVVCQSNGQVDFASITAKKVWSKLAEPKILFQNALSREEASTIRSLWSSTEVVRLYEFTEVNGQVCDLLFQQVNVVGQEPYRVIMLTPGLEESMLLRAIGETAGKYGHDLNNLLGSILGATDLVDSKLKKLHGEPHPLERQVSLVHSALEKAVTLTTQMRGYVRMETPPKSKVDLETLLNKLVTIITENTKEETNIIVVCNQQVSIDASEFQLLQALHAIVGNALDAIHKQSEKCLLLMTNVIDQQDENNQQMVEIIVLDHGKGMPKSSISNALKAFYSEKQTKIGGGLGLGLPMAKQIIVDHGGSLSINSLPDVGTAVRILLPVV